MIWKLKQWTYKLYFSNFIFLFCMYAPFELSKWGVYWKVTFVHLFNGERYEILQSIHQINVDNKKIQFLPCHNIVHYTLNTLKTGLHGQYGDLWMTQGWKFQWRLLEVFGINTLEWENPLVCKSLSWITDTRKIRYTQDAWAFKRKYER